MVDNNSAQNEIITEAGGKVRPMRPEDRETIRKICCETAYRNEGSDLLFEDREIHADYWTSYFTDYKWSDSWVVEEDGKIVGYLHGCTDQEAFMKVMSRKIVPKCLFRAIFRLLTGKYKKPQSRRYIQYALFRAWKETVIAPASEYPAHYHCNIRRQGYGKRYYSDLVTQFAKRLDEKGIDTIQLAYTEPESKGIYTRIIFRLKLDKCAYFEKVPTSLFQFIIGDEKPMMNYIWAGKVSDFRVFLTAMRDKFKI